MSWNKSILESVLSRNGVAVMYETIAPKTITNKEWYCKATIYSPDEEDCVYPYVGNFVEVRVKDGPDAAAKVENDAADMLLYKIGEKSQ